LFPGTGCGTGSSRGGTCALAPKNVSSLPVGSYRRVLEDVLARHEVEGVFTRSQGYVRLVL